MRQDGSSKMQCAKQAMQCLKGCVADENEALDEIAAMEDESSSVSYVFSLVYIKIISLTIINNNILPSKTLQKF